MMHAKSSPSSWPIPAGHGAAPKQSLDTVVLTAYLFTYGDR